jgi:lantibiotic modifying enzyme
MSLSAAVMGEPQSREPSSRLVSGRDLRCMLEALAAFQFSSSRARPLAKLCAAGVDYGWGELERTVGRDLLSETSARARASLRRYLQRRLERITRPCFELEWTSFKLAMNAVGVPSSDAALTERMFLRDRPWDRLSLLFQKFPVLAKLWCLTIDQWRGHVLEVLNRVRRDGPALSRFFFNKSSIGAILNLRLGLSDPHHGGRSVTLIEFRGNRRVIYKPRSGASESAWFSFLDWMNRNGFRPKLPIARVLLRKGYYWMEYVEPASCENEAAASRFYKRMGGLIAAAYLLKAVDCHRENVIAVGEYPVLVDIDALWHVSPLTKTQSPVDVLYRTGFFPNSKRKSLQSRSSVLGKATRGAHLACIAGKPVAAASYKEDIVKGFVQAWDCIMRTPGRRAAFYRKVRCVRSHQRRWIYRATERYAAILRASILPSVLRSGAARNAWLRQSCLRSGPGKAVIQAEIKALRQLDIPYFSRRTNGWMPPEKDPLPSELCQGIRNALQWTEN